MSFRIRAVMMPSPLDSWVAMQAWHRGGNSVRVIGSFILTSVPDTDSFNPDLDPVKNQNPDPNPSCFSLLLPGINIKFI